MSKNCTICVGARSIKQEKEEQYEEILSNHNCQINFKGSAGMSRTKILFVQNFFWVAVS